MNREKLNNMLRDFLIRKRELAELSQSDVAARSEIYGMGKTLDQRTVSRIERQPINADAIKIAGYLSAVGVPPQQYYHLLTELTYKKDGQLMTFKKKNDISEQFSVALDRVAEVRSIVKDLTYGPLRQLKLDDSFDEVEIFLKSFKKKPVIGFFGHFDVGKSTLVNTVLNQTILPARYTPATSLINWVTHVEDRPPSISGTVAVFRKDFNPYMMHDSDHVAEHLIEEGDPSLLSRLGVHDYDESIANDAYVAMVFSTSDILRHVWLMDTPGDLNSTDNSDTEKALGSVEFADGIVFISNHAGFFKESDLGIAVNVIRLRPPVRPDEITDHLLFVQSHCHSEISTEEVLEVGRLTFRRIKKQLDNLLFNPWKDDGYIESTPSEEELTARVQPFWRENEDFRTQTLTKINYMAEYLVTHHEKVVADKIEVALDRLARILRNAVDVLEVNKKSTVERINEIEAQTAQFREESEKLINRFENLIVSCGPRKFSDIELMRNYFESETSEDGLVRIIEQTYGDDKKAAQTEIGNYIGQLLTVRVERILKKSGKSVSDKVEELLKEWQRATPSIQKAQLKVGVGDIDNVSAFDSNAAFASGLIGLGALGAMSLYVSSAIASNLGAYILIGHVAGWLTSLGVVGSVTTVTSFVAAIGGPITIGIGLAAVIGSLAYRLIGGSWQKRLAKQVAAQIRKKNVWNRIEKPINDFWDSTEKAILSGLRETRLQTEQHIDSLRKDASEEYDISKLDGCIQTVQEAIHSLGKSGFQGFNEDL